MGFFPCERCQRAYKGKQQTMYPALLDGATDPRMRRRLCPPCFESVSSWMTQHMHIVRVGDLAAEGTDMDIVAAAPCFVEGCGEQVTTSIFVTKYAQGHEREDWFGRSCTEHDALARTALLATQAQLPTP